MDTRNKDSLRSLFEGFMDAGQAEKSAEDIRQGDRILAEHPAPEPSNELIAAIKREAAETLRRSRHSVSRKVALKTAAAAAVVLIAVLVGRNLFEQGATPAVTANEMIPTEIWESSDLAVDDAELAVLNAEIDQLENELIALRLGETGGNGTGELTELEMELIVVDNEFWKG